MAEVHFLRLMTFTATLEELTNVPKNNSDPKGRGCKREMTTLTVRQAKDTMECDALHRLLSHFTQNVSQDMIGDWLNLEMTITVLNFAFVGSSYYD